MTTTLSAEALALCAAIDAGDLYVLADVLEERGLPRWQPHQGKTTHRRRSYQHWPTGWYWYSPGGHSWGVDRAEYAPLAVLPRKVFLRLTGHTRDGAKRYPTRVAAYLALAEALLEE